MLFQESFHPFHHILKKSEVDVVQNVGFRKVRRIYPVEFREYIAVNFHSNLMKMVGDTSSLSLPVLSRLLCIISIVTQLVCVPRILLKLCGWNLTPWA